MSRFQAPRDIKPGNVADLALWSPSFIGVKPDLLIKDGSIGSAPMGDLNASMPTPLPGHCRPMSDALGRSMAPRFITCLPQAAIVDDCTASSASSA